jgi:hypothetical protein
MKSNKNNPLSDAEYQINGKPEIGQMLYHESAKGNIKSEKIVRIGTKFIFLEDSFGNIMTQYPIDKKSLLFAMKKYSQNNRQYYRTEQEILDRNERHDLYMKIKDTFDFWKGKKIDDFTIKQLRDILEIINQTA